MVSLANAVDRKVLRWAGWGICIVMVMGPSCSEPESRGTEESVSPERPDVGEPDAPAAEPEQPAEAVGADVTAVRVSGAPGAYTFSVTIRSPDTGCDQYANWWEVISADGELIYRRILAHSHVGEQPFTRSGGPVELEATTQAIVRAHMNEAGYGGVAFSGSPASGFGADPSITAALAAELADEGPQPNGCAF